MKINFLEGEKNRIVFELQGDDQTLANALKEELWNDENVKISSYAMKHPETGIPTFIVETKNISAKEAVINACKRLETTNKKIISAFSKI